VVLPVAEVADVARAAQARPCLLELEGVPNSPLRVLKRLVLGALLQNFLKFSEFAVDDHARGESAQELPKGKLVGMIKTFSKASTVLRELQRQGRLMSVNRLTVTQEDLHR